MTSQQPTEEKHSIAGIFADSTAAQSANKALQAAGFLADQISTDTQVIRAETASEKNPNLTAQESKAKESGKSGAIVGALFGGMASALLTLGGKDLPGSSPVASIEPSGSAFIVILLGIVVGAVAGGLIAALSGTNVAKTKGTTEQVAPEENRPQAAQKYLVKVVGNKDELQRAREVLQQQGSEV